jgi:hypothetical protein
VLTPHTFEQALPLAATERDDFADPELRRPRRPPYNRAAQREAIRASLLADLHTHAYDRETK